jgi:hypothetical protein
MQHKVEVAFKSVAFHRQWHEVTAFKGVGQCQGRQTPNPEIRLDSAFNGLGVL